MSNPRKTERVARAICNAARMEHQPDKCPICGGTNGSVCVMWEKFTGEADAAMKAMKGF